ncbi:hypothetical protein [Paraburkholderia phenoliruptrix]|uniref:hypothetical protein n=1 Tax=Paraburkholderia phenoliruptrix TaxID=252970 RepID=UPI003D952DAF
MPAGSVLRGVFVFAIMLVMRCGRRILLDCVNATKPSALQVHRPEWNSMFCLDQERARASRQRLLAHAASTGATVFAAHFAETSAE